MGCFVAEEKSGCFDGANSIGIAPLMTLSASHLNILGGIEISGSPATLISVSKGLKNKCRHRSGGVCRSDDCTAQV